MSTPSTPPVSNAFLGRQITFKVLRGNKADLAVALPLAWGEMFFTEDTFQLFFGTPGVGVGYIQIGDVSGVNETLLKILQELQAMRKAIVALACDGNRNVPADFEPFADGPDNVGSSQG